MTHSAALILRAGRLRLLGLPFLLGALTVLGFAPFHLYFLPVLTLAALFHLWLHAGSRRASFLVGWMFGLGLYGFGVSWVYVSMHDYGLMPMPMAAFATLLFCAFLALFPAFAGWLQSLIHPPKTIRLLFLMPGVTAFYVWSLGWFMTGFPWLTFGYTQAPNSPLAGYAPLFGVYGITLVLLFSAGLLACLYGAWRERSGRGWLALSALLLVWVIGALLQDKAWTTPVGQPFRVTLLQGNIPQDLKWREDRLVNTLETYHQQIMNSDSRLIILPETAIPLFYDEVPPSYLEELGKYARYLGGDIILGLPERDFVARRYYNSVLSLGTAPTQFYRKHHLVPFGEYVPLKPIFGGIIAAMQIPLTDFARGAATQQPLAVAGQQVAVNICYEDVFGEEIIRQLPKATLLANVSNDAWFGDSIAPRQHLQISQMRALETGRYMLRATNTGITAIVNEKGRVLQQAPVFHTIALHGEAQGFQGATPYVRWANTPFLIAMSIMLVLPLLIALLKRQRI